MPTLPSAAHPNATDATDPGSRALRKLADAFFERFDRAPDDGKVTLDELKDVTGALPPGLNGAVTLLFNTYAGADTALSRSEVEGLLPSPGSGTDPGGLGAIASVLGVLMQPQRRSGRPDDTVGKGDDRPPPPKPGAGKPDDAPPLPPTVEQFVDEFIAKFDGADGSTKDKAVSLAELLAALAPKREVPGFEKRLAPVVDHVDTSNDGVMSRDELITAIRALDADRDASIDDVPGRLHGATVKLIGVFLQVDDTPPPHGG